MARSGPASKQEVSGQYSCGGNAEGGLRGATGPGPLAEYSWATVRSPGLVRDPEPP